VVVALVPVADVSVEVVPPVADVSVVPEVLDCEDVSVSCETVVVEVVSVWTTAVSVATVSVVTVSVDSCSEPPLHETAATRAVAQSSVTNFFMWCFSFDFFV
jgi:hypothetical protein